jgi:hypothetical protein
MSKSTNIWQRLPSDGLLLPEAEEGEMENVPLLTVLTTILVVSGSAFLYVVNTNRRILHRAIMAEFFGGVFTAVLISLVVLICTGTI